MTCIRASNIKADSRLPAALPAAKPVHFPGHLSKASVVGAVIGSLLGAALTAGAVWWFGKRGRRQDEAKRLPAAKEEDDTSMSTQKDGREIYQMDAKGSPAQLDVDDAQRAELGHGAPRSELAGDPFTCHELAGSTPTVAKD